MPKSDAPPYYSYLYRKFKRLRCDGKTRETGITILIPTYNRAAVLADCLESISSCLYGHRIRVIVANNASEDCTLSVLSRFFNLRLHIINRSTNIGLLGNLTDLLLECRTRYAFILTDDDRLSCPDSIFAIANNVASMKECGAAYSYSPLPTYDADMNFLTGIVRRDYSENTFIAPSDRVSIRCSSTSAWALSRQIWDLEKLPWEFWMSQYHMNNAYLMVGVAALAGYRFGTYYTKDPVVCHRYGNTVHWTEWGHDVIMRRIKLETDMWRTQNDAIAELSTCTEVDKQFLKLSILKEFWQDWCCNAADGLPSLLSSFSSESALSIARRMIDEQLLKDSSENIELCVKSAGESQAASFVSTLLAT